MKNGTQKSLRKRVEAVGDWLQDKRIASQIRSVDQSNISQQLKTTGLILAGCFVANTVAMMGAEGMSLGQALWENMLTATTLGYGSGEPLTGIGRITSTALALDGFYTFGRGIFIANDLYQANMHKKAQGHFDWSKSGLFRRGIKDHVVFLNAPKEDTEQYCVDLVDEFRNSDLPQKEKYALIVTPHVYESHVEDFTTELVNYQASHVNYNPVSSYNSRVKKAFQFCNIAKASTLVVTANAVGNEDLDRLMSYALNANPDVEILLDCPSKNGQPRFEQAGPDFVNNPREEARKIVIRKGWKPGENRHFENTANLKAVRDIYHAVSLKGEWKKIQRRLIDENIGIAVGYRNNENERVLNPPANDNIEAKGVYVIPSPGEENLHKSEEDLAAAAGEFYQDLAL